jgi:alcohol dehydrogenase class IV
MPVMNHLTTCHFDTGMLAKVRDIAQGAGISKPFVVTDPGLKANGHLDRLLAALGGAPAGIYSDTPANPTERAARAGAAHYLASGADGIIAMGGGSSMDMGKAIGLIARHAGDLDRFGGTLRGAKHITPIPPLIAIPTTAGTGSEVSVGFVLILENGRKETFVSPHLVPNAALCDPELTYSLPAQLTAATGMDAVTHCIEAVLSPAINPPAEAIGYDGVWRAIGQGMLKRAVANGQDSEARWHMMMASYEGALSFVRGLGAVHGLSHALGRLEDLNLHHGTLNAVILPHALAMIEEAGAAPEKRARLAQAMGLAAGTPLSGAITDLNAAIGIPASLSAIGVMRAQMDGALDYAVSDLATASNAIKIDCAGYADLFDRSF